MKQQQQLACDPKHTARLSAGKHLGLNFVILLGQGKASFTFARLGQAELGEQGRCVNRVDKLSEKVLT